MKQILFVISDLHLGGAPASDGKPSFQMCSEKGRARLAEFIGYAASQRNSNRDVHLVINGDIVDFLAEEEFAAFTDSDEKAGKKLENILNNTDQVWKSLKAFLSSGAKLTLLLGNHDIELSFPTPRRLLLDRLGPGSIDFLYDNQAFVEGPVLIEHGNSYDWWNVIPHNTLRHIRSALSRGASPREIFDIPAGSLLVFNVMNKIKQEYSFIDLLKPEDGAILPLLAVLKPAAMTEIESLYEAMYGAGLKKWELDFDEEGWPVDPNNIAIPVDVANKDGEMIDLARKLGYGTSPTNISVSGTVKSFIELWRIATSAHDKQVQLKRLYDALHARATATWKAFDVNDEDPVYLKPAKAAANKRGFQVVVFGHTHLVKRVPLNDDGAVYLNTGTWADLMWIPEAVLDGKETEGLQQLEQFANDIAANDLTRWRKHVPTFARIDLDGNSVESADVFVFEGPAETQIHSVPRGRLDLSKWGSAISPP